MTYEEKALQVLLLDDDWPSCLNEWLGGVNILDVLKVNRREIMHSNILAWLLNPKESHGLSTAFLESFLKRICQNGEVKEKMPFLIANWKNATVSREWGTEKRRLDILVRCPCTNKKSLVLAIENKIDAKDSMGQLNAYYKEVLKVFPRADNRGRHLFIYLTPNGDDPVCNNETDVWIKLSYADIVSILDEVMAIQVQMPQNLRELLHDYNSLIRREIMTDFNLDKCCNDIYRKHKEAFDLVFNHADMSGAVGEAKSAIKQFLQEKCKQSNGEIIFTGDRKGTQSVLSFQSKAMNSCLSQLQSGTKGSWMNEDVYYYWFDVNKYNGRVRLIVEFGLNNVTGTLLENMARIGKIINSKKSLEEGVFRRLKPYKVGDIGDDFDGKVFIPKVEAAIAKLREDEEKWLSYFNKGGREHETE